MPNGRCKVHGGKSTGPRTPEGLERSKRANWKHGYYSREAKAERSRVRAAILALRYLRIMERVWASAQSKATTAKRYPIGWPGQVRPLALTNTNAHKYWLTMSCLMPASTPQNANQIKDVLIGHWAAGGSRTASLGITDRQDPLAVVLAKFIIELAKEGERDPGKLCEGALKILRKSQ
jgi:hypothetical protein